MGTFFDHGRWWWRLGTGAKQGPYESLEQCEAEYREALRKRHVNNPLARGNRKWIRS